MDYVFDIHHGSTVIPDDVGAVAVIDGSKSYISTNGIMLLQWSLTWCLQKI
jgi:hypothetical protein